jgi:hypothetical protein
VKRRILIALAAVALLALTVDLVRVAVERRPYGRLVVPLMLQTDYQDAVCVIGGQKKSVATSGCGATCIAMAAAALVDSGETPGTLFQWAYDSGLYFGDGLGHEAMSAMAVHAGLTGEWLDNDPEMILEALRAGRRWRPTWGPARLPGTVTTFC